MGEQPASVEGILGPPSPSAEINPNTASIQSQINTTETSSIADESDPSSLSSSASDNKLERNVFSWITDTIKKSFMSSAEKKSTHSLPASFANMFDANGDLLLNAVNQYNNGDATGDVLSGNPSFDQIVELTRRFRLDG